MFALPIFLCRPSIVVALEQSELYRRYIYRRDRRGGHWPPVNVCMELQQQIYVIWITTSGRTYLPPKAAVQSGRPVCTVK